MFGSCKDRRTRTNGEVKRGREMTRIADVHLRHHPGRFVGRWKNGVGRVRLPAIKRRSERRSWAARLVEAEDVRALDP